MRTITFDQLPQEIACLVDKVASMETLLNQLLHVGDSGAAKDEILTIEEAAKLLHLSVPTVYGLVSRRSLPFNKRGKRLYFSKKELTDWVLEGRMQTSEEIEQEALRTLVTKNKRR